MDAKKARELEAKCRPDSAEDLNFRGLGARTRTFAFRYFDPDKGVWRVHQSVEVEYYDTRVQGPGGIRGRRHRLFEPPFL